jgi:hypothetical protein
MVGGGKHRPWRAYFGEPCKDGQNSAGRRELMLTDICREKQREEHAADGVKSI